MTDEDAIKFYEELVDHYGDKLPNFEHHPIQFANCVRMYKYYKEQYGRPKPHLASGCEDSGCCSTKARVPRCFSSIRSQGNEQQQDDQEPPPTNARTEAFSVDMVSLPRRSRLLWQRSERSIGTRVRPKDLHKSMSIVCHLASLIEWPAY